MTYPIHGFLNHHCGFFSFGFITVCIFLISNEKTSLGEIFIMDTSNGIKFQPSITITNMRGEEGVPGDMHKIQGPRKCWANDLPLYSADVLEISGGAQC